MKVRFNQSKERQPDVENGLRVLYGPGRRTAYRMRWYLILALALSPLVYVFGRLALAALNIEVPAQLEMPVTEVRANQRGLITDMYVKQNDSIPRLTTGSMLFRIENPEWVLRQRQLQYSARPLPLPLPMELAGPGGRPDQANRFKEDISSGRSLIDLQRQVVDLQEAIKLSYAKLKHKDAFSNVELLQANVQLELQRKTLAELQRRLYLDWLQYRSQRRNDVLQAQIQENQYLRDQAESRLISDNYLTPTTFPHPGRISELLVDKGEFVEAGTTLMRIQRYDISPILWVYLSARDTNRIKVHDILEVRMPDGSILQARVINPADMARLLPRGLRSSVGGEGLASLGAEGLNLKLPARFVKELPAKWRVDQLPLLVRLPRRWTL